jgi:hypothetical protein
LRSLTTLCGEYSAALDRPCRHLSLSGAQYPMSSYTRQHLERLQRDGMDGRTALEIVGSVMYFARKTRRYCLTTSGSRCISATRSAMPCRSRNTRRSVGERVSSTTYRGPHRGHLDARSANSSETGSGSFFKNVFDAIDREVTRKTEATLILAEPFITPDAR